jgi:branched-chain amino acid transport system substrate-binding protein
MRFAARNFALAAAFCSLATIATTAPALAQSSQPVRIGVLMPTKSLVGKQGQQGAALAAEMLNADGGILGGRKIELVVYDTNFQPAEGVSAAQRLLNQDKVKFIAGEISSTVALAVVQLAQANGALFMAAVPKHPDVTASGYDRVFRLNSTTAMDAKDFDAVLTDKLKPTKVAVLAENSDFGRLTVTNMRTLFGSKLVAAENYEMTQNDFSTLVTKVKGSGADLVCIAGSNMEQYGNILRLMQELKVDAKRCVMPGILNSEGVRVAGNSAEGAISADIYVPTLDNPLNKRFVAAYEAKFKETPEKIEVLGFESIWLLAKAMQKAGTADDTAKVAKVLHDEKWETPRGTVTFDKNGQAQSGALINLTVKNGKLISTP